MKILYISPENTVGTLNLWKKAHERRGNECIFITLFSSKHKFQSDICLNLPLISSGKIYDNLRNKYYQLYRGELGNYKEKKGFPPQWRPNSLLENYFFQFRDWLWSFKVEKLISQLSLLEYDIIHLEWGLEFYRNGSFVKRLNKLGKPIICTYHGQDLRTRGVIPVINRISSLNLTSELDLIDKHPNIKYLFLPFDTQTYKPQYKLNNPIKICHSPTNRYYKGSEKIISVCKQISTEFNAEFILIENMSHSETLQIKSECDIFIDQIYGRGGWGYGMNSIEALSMGLCCMTEMNTIYEKFLPDHPFININSANMYTKIKDLLSHPKLILYYKKRGHIWVKNYHDIDSTIDKLYNYYNQYNLIK